VSLFHFGGNILSSLSKTRDTYRDEGGSGVISGALSLTISTIIIKILGLIYKIPLASFLGDEGMGYFNSAYTVYGLFYLLCTAGVPKAVTVLVTEARVKGKDISGEKIVRVALSAFLTIGALATICFVALSGPISEFIGNSKARATMLAVAPSVIFISLGGVLRGYLTAGMNLFSVAVAGIIEGVGKLVIGLVFANFAYTSGLSCDVISAYTILGVTIGSALGFIFLLICSKNAIFRKNIGQNKSEEKNGSVLKRIFSISLPITVSAAVMSIGSIVDLTVIMRRLIDAGYSQLEATSLYGNYTTYAVPMFNLVIALITPLSTAFLPVFVKARVCGELIMQEESYKNSFTLSAIVSAPMILGMAVFSREILTVIFGEGGVSIGAPLLTMLMPGAFFMSVLLMVNTALEARGDVRTPVISMSVATVFKVIISSALLSHPDFGISGAPIGTAVSYAVALSISVLVSVKKHGMRPPVLSTHVLPYLNAFVSVTVARGLHRRMIADYGALPSLAAAILTCAFIYLLMSVLSGTLSVKRIKKMAKYTKAT